MLSWILRYVTLGFWLRHIVRAEVIGLENLPHRGAYILALGSHKTEVESGIVAAWLYRRRLHFYAKAEYWQRGRLRAWFMTAIGQIPVERGDAAKTEVAIEAGAQVLKQGEVLAVYPEGTRSPDDKLHGGHAGFARTLIRSGMDIPVIPVGLIGMEAVSPARGYIPRPGNVKIVIGEPIYLKRAERLAIKSGRAGQNLAAIRLTARVMPEIAKLCGKQYVTKRLPTPERNDRRKWRR